MTAISVLPERWRSKAGELSRYSPAAARAFADAAQQLEQALRDAGDEVLTLREAATISGYSPRRLREFVRDGDLANVGRKGAPRFRRGDLPRKIRKAGPYDPEEHARSLLAY